MAILDRGQIDTQKWDEVIAQSPAETLYAYSWYLDAATANWSALIMGNYQFAMPLVWKRKLGLRYLYQPFYSQQLGVFSKEFVDPILIKNILSTLRKKYRFASINFNSSNLVGDENPFTVADKTNYVLDLRPGYESLHDSYSTNAKRNIKKALDLNERVSKEISIREFVAFKRNNDVIKRTEKEYQWLVTLLESIRKLSTGKVYATREEGTIIAAAFFGFCKTKAIYLVSASNDRGKEGRAMFRIVDEFIREHSGSELILDFEGSNIPNVARFFTGFGAVPEIYQNVGFSRLPGFVTRWKNNG